jgi:hypothetical protein
MSLHAEHPPVVAIHAYYCRLTGHDLELNFEREHFWMLWLHHRWTAADLALVVRAIKKAIIARERKPAALLFRNLIGDTGRFEEDLSHYRALARMPRRDPGRSRALAATGRSEETINTARSVADIIAGEQAFAAFRALKETL